VGRARLIVLGLLIAIVALLFLLPVVVESHSVINLVIKILLYVILASSWNILGGYTGQTNLGLAAFFGLGTLTTRLLWMGGVSIFVSLPIAGVVALSLALLIGAPAFRLRGVYFAIGTLAIAQILYVTVGNVFPRLSSLPATYLTTYQLLPRYYVFVSLTLFTVGTAYVLVHSKLGLGMMAVREEEDAAESLGVSAFRHKLLALCVSSVFAGWAGGAYAWFQVGYYPQFPFSVSWTFDSMMMVYIGGAGTLLGPVIGAVFYVLLQEFLSQKLLEVHMIVFGILFILIILFLPGGFTEIWGRIRHLVAPRSRMHESPLLSRKGHG